MGQAITATQRTVLVVDDEAIIRHDLVDMLEENGFEVLDAQDADEAVGLLETHPEIGAVVTDVQMPGSMDGIKLVHYIRDRWPPAVLFVISAQKLGEGRSLPSHTAFYDKPLDGRRFIKDLNAALSA
jgi:CheY-like chemotaxis protein